MRLVSQNILWKFVPDWADTSCKRSAITNATHINKLSQIQIITNTTQIPLHVPIPEAPVSLTLMGLEEAPKEASAEGRSAAARPP